MPLPGLSKAKGPKQSAAEHRSALIKADNNLAATRECQSDQRQRFAKGAS